MEQILKTKKAMEQILKTKKTARPRAVDFHTNPDDFQVPLLGSMGFSAQFIAEYTKLTLCQVRYRLGLSGVNLSDYRRGGGFAKVAIKRLATPVGAELRNKLRI